MNYKVDEQTQKNSKFTCIECGKTSTAEEWDQATCKAVDDEAIVPIVYGTGEDTFYYCPHCHLENNGADLK